MTHPISKDHEYCTVDIIEQLMEQGYRCYIEYDILTGKGKRQRITPDIYAIKDTQQIFVEIGTLSKPETRFSIIKSFYPNAKIIHVIQWKNYGITESSIEYRMILKKLENQPVDMNAMGQSLKPKQEIHP